MADLGTNIEMSLYDAKQVPKGRYVYGGKNFKIFQMQKFLNVKEMPQSHVVSCQLLS